jgi:hypothetical protein
MSCSVSIRACIGLICFAALTVSASCLSNAAETISEKAFNRCQAIPDESARIHCLENLASQAPQTAPSRPQLAPSGSPNAPDNSQNPALAAPTSHPIAGKWRLVRTPNPQDGQDVVSIMATAEFSGSDPDFAGLILRCSDSGFEILVFLIRPLPPRARPVISINGKKFDGSVVPPGASIRLPQAATNLLNEQWHSLSDLSIDVEDNGTTIRGVVSLKGFGDALQTLTDACLTR